MPMPQTVKQHVKEWYIFSKFFIQFHAKTNNQLHFLLVYRNIEKSNEA